MSNTLPAGFIACYIHANRGCQTVKTSCLPNRFKPNQSKLYWMKPMEWNGINGMECHVRHLKPSSSRRRARASRTALRQRASSVACAYTPTSRTYLKSFLFFRSSAPRRAFLSMLMPPRRAMRARAAARSPFLLILGGEVEIMREEVGRERGKAGAEGVFFQSRRLSF